MICYPYYVPWIHDRALILSYCFFMIYLKLNKISINVNVLTLTIVTITVFNCQLFSDFILNYDANDF